MNLDAAITKANLIKAVRRFFEAQNFQEIQVPVLNYGLPLEPNLFAFETEWQTLEKPQKLYLPFSPESNMKKLLAAGLEECFTIGHCFRNLEASGSTHTPEFFMLEWYRPDMTYEKIMSDTEELIAYCLKQLPDTKPAFPIDSMPWPRLSVRELTQKYAHFDLADYLEEKELFKLAQQKGYNTDNSSWSQIFDQIFLNEVEPHLPAEPFFMIDFPSRVSPLCRPKPSDPRFAERFELYINHIEVGNGNSEHLDRERVAAAFDREAKLRSQNGQPFAPVDQAFMASLDILNQRFEKLAGMGLGIDRLAMLIANTDTIQGVSPINVS